MTNCGADQAFRTAAATTLGIRSVKNKVLAGRFEFKAVQIKLKELDRMTYSNFSHVFRISSWRLGQPEGIGTNFLSVFPPEKGDL